MAEHPQPFYNQHERLLIISSFSCLQIKLQETILEMQLTPFSILLRVLLDQLQTKDQARIFTQPVDVNEVITADAVVFVFICFYSLDAVRSSNW